MENVVHLCNIHHIASNILLIDSTVFFIIFLFLLIDFSNPKRQINKRNNLLNCRRGKSIAYFITKIKLNNGKLVSRWNTHYNRSLDSTCTGTTN